MSLRGRFKISDRKVSPPGPAYMSDDQFANYLADLRSFQPKKPSGARPLPSTMSGRTDSYGAASVRSRASVAREFFQQAEEQQRSASSASHQRSGSSQSFNSMTSRHGRQLVQQPSVSSTARASSTEAPKEPLKPSDVVPTATYIERGQRWMEKEEAVSLRTALEDMKLSKENGDEVRIFAAAQDEASELVWQHQNGQQPEEFTRPNYKEHLRKNSYAKARTASVGPIPVELETGLARDVPRSVSNSSNESGLSYRSRVSSACSMRSQAHSTDPEGRPSIDSVEFIARDKPLKTYPRQPLGRRRSSGRRNISGEIGKTFTTDQIWEEPGENELAPDIPASVEDAPAPLRIKPKNPLNRVQFESPSQEDGTPVPAPKLNNVEIHRNPPTQSRNAEYTVNQSIPITTSNDEEVKMRDGKEIRGEDIVQATSMRLKDRSPHLPMPTAISMKPGRPIVSFDANWKPKEADDKPEEPTPAALDPIPQKKVPIQQATRGAGSPTKDVPPVCSVTPTVTTTPPTTQRRNVFARPNRLKGTGWNSPRTQTPEPVQGKTLQNSPISKGSATTNNQSSNERPIPAINLPDERPPVPSINVSDTQRSVRTINLPSSNPPIPSINLPESSPSIPQINLPDPSPSIPVINLPDCSPSIPTINLPDSSPSIPTINVPDMPSISVSEHQSVGTPQSSNRGSQRPLPDPKSAASRRVPPVQSQRNPWSRVVGKRATVKCHQCEIPIEGKIVAVQGVQERFHPECLSCYTCGIALEAMEISPEPEPHRAARLDRIQRRQYGEILDEVDGETAAEDGDPRLRFYCHLDWHELFAPRCKHCKTPILGEHIVALGEHWHKGHFFCAECGDPFDGTTTHIEKDGYAWCLNCQTKRTERRAPKCKGCKQPVIGVYTIAMGGEWHEACFCCVQCGRGFSDGQIYPKEVDGVKVPVCVKCMQYEWKS